MKTTRFIWGLVVAGFCMSAAEVLAQVTAFTYQGVLNDGGPPATGTYDFSFGAYDGPTAGNLISPLVTNSAVEVSNGLFTTTVDFGAGIFGGEDLWLEITVSTNSADDFSTIAPRQEFTPTPYALFAAKAGTAQSAATASDVGAGGVTAPALSTAGAPAAGQVLAFDGTQLVWQSPVVGGNTGGWSVSGNTGTSPSLNFLGTVDSEPLELRVASARALRLEPDTSGNGAPNVIGGSAGNYVSNTIFGATIGGGGGTSAVYSNIVSAGWGTIGGGAHNLAGGYYSFVGGGYDNVASGYIATVAGGAYNLASSNEAAVLGGAYNVASGIGSVVAGGGWDGNNPLGNVAGGVASAIGGGLRNSAGGGQAAVTGGYDNNASGPTAFIGSGEYNVASGSDLVFIGSGIHASFIEGFSTVSGGDGNVASATGATVPGGAFNTAAGDFSFAGGYHAYAAHEGSFVWADDSSSSALSTTAADQFLVRASGGVILNGPLTVGDNFTASIGCADLKIGWSGRRGSPGRALTDFGTVLNINCCGDWATTYVGGGNFSVCSLTVRGGCDVAEPFDISEPALDPGSVVVIDPKSPGKLKLSQRPYDSRVAGVISGANGINSGISLHQEGVFEGGQNVALSGRVYVLAEAANGAIEAGDLLTTGVTPGHAMKVTDHLRAQGAILGKAMSNLDHGTGLVLVLVTLQ